jgi:hypothetical protein
MSLLKIKDENGNIIEIPALKGKDGHTPIKSVDYWTDADKAAILRDVFDGIIVEYPDAHIIYGDVDSENNIMLFGDLSEGAYFLKYENEDGTVTEIGALIINPNTPVYTNLIPSSINSDGTLYNNGQGWKENSRTNSSGEEVTQEGMEVTGFMPAKLGDTVYLKNILFNTTTANTGRCCIALFDSNFAYLGLTKPKTATDLTEITLSYETIETQKGALTTTAYIRISSDEITNDSIVTVNEVITQGDR